jgi:hypothetical protein
MRRRLAGLLVGGALVAAGGAAVAHHSRAMFDQNTIELEGVVQEFKWTNPHSFIFLEVKEADGSTTVWNLEGVPPATLAREGWSLKSLKPGDVVKIKVMPLLSGAPGGAWNTGDVKFRDGKPVEMSH